MKIEPIRLDQMQFWSSKFLCLKLLLHLIKELISLRCFMIITIILYYLKLIMVLMRCYSDLSLYFQFNFQALSLSLSFPTFLSSVSSLYCRQHSGNVLTPLRAMRKRAWTHGMLWSSPLSCCYCAFILQLLL